MKIGQARVSTIAPVQRRILLEPGGWPRSAKCSSAVPEAQPTGRGKVCKGPRQDVRCLHRDDLAAADNRCLSRFSVPLLPKPQVQRQNCPDLRQKKKTERADQLAHNGSFSGVTDSGGRRKVSCG